MFYIIIIFSIPEVQEVHIGISVALHHAKETCNFGLKHIDEYNDLIGVNQLYSSHFMLDRLYQKEQYDEAHAN